MKILRNIITPEAALDCKIENNFTEKIEAFKSIKEATQKYLDWIRKHSVKTNDAVINDRITYSISFTHTDGTLTKVHVKFFLENRGWPTYEFCFTTNNKLVVFKSDINDINIIAEYVKCALKFSMKNDLDTNNLSNCLSIKLKKPQLNVEKKREFIIDYLTTHNDQTKNTIINFIVDKYINSEHYKPDEVADYYISKFNNADVEFVYYMLNR